MNVARVTDSTAALHDVGSGSGWSVVPLEVEIGGARYREGPELSGAELYRMIHTINTPPVTLPPSVDTFADTYAALLAEHERVLSVHLSGELSETVARARTAAERLGAGGRILVFDSRLAGAAVGLLCLEAEARLEAGAGLEAVVTALAEIVTATRAWFSVYTLDFLYLGGRLERRAGVGPVKVEDRPILALQNGRLELLERVVGETTRVERTLELLKHDFGPKEELVAAIVHAGPRGETAAGRLEQVLANDSARSARCYRAPLGPVLCAHTGFDVCGVAVYPSRLSALTSRN